jgi:cellulose synthase/poly-beta-1,6-N-acetylglucosamine synthase-like glycosyltransferase
MIVALSAILELLAAIVLFVTSVFAIEIFVACCFARSRSDNRMEIVPDRIAVLIPAHNEESGISQTLRNIQSNLIQGDRLVVVADNCTDKTAEVAQVLGSEVTVRTDPSKRGKGFALDWGLDYLAADPPDVVVIVDADCTVAGGTLRILAAVATRLDRPVQALYVMTAPARSSVGQQVGEFAWLVKNHVRPLGLKVMKLPSQLMGTGMAFPWRLIRSVSLASGHIVEDLKLGLDLAQLGSAPEFYPEVIVSSTFPASAEGIRAQRQRWEHGHIYMIGHVALPLLWKGLLRRDFRLAALSLDLMVPPISLLSFVILALLVVTGTTLAFGWAERAFVLAFFCFVLLTSSIIVAWVKFGMDTLPPKSLLRVPAYLAEKVPVYAKLIVGKGVSNWIRSDRT